MSKNFLRELAEPSATFVPDTVAYLNDVSRLLIDKTLNKCMILTSLTIQYESQSTSRRAISQYLY